MPEDVHFQQQCCETLRIYTTWISWPPYGNVD